MPGPVLSGQQRPKRAGGSLTARSGIVVLDSGRWDAPNRITADRFDLTDFCAMLRRSPDCRARIVHVPTPTRDALAEVLSNWAKRRRAFPILLIAGHGLPGVVEVGRGPRCVARVDLDWIEAQLTEKAHGAVIFVASCECLALHGNRLRRFVDRTGALAVCGYTQEVEYVRAAALELLMLAEMSRTRIDRRGVRRLAVSIGRLARSAPFAELGFRIVIR